MTDIDFTTGVLVDESGTDSEPTLLRVFRLRGGDEAPHKLDAQRVPTPVELQANESITDWTHVVVWPDRYAAFDSRRDAPGLSRLSTYLREMVDQHVRFFPYYDRSLIDELESLDEVKSIDVKFQLSKAEQLAELQNRGLFGGLIGIGREVDAATIRTKVSVGTSRKRFLRSWVRQEIVGVADHAEELLDNLVISGVRDNETVHIDLMRRRLDVSLTVARSKALGNAPDPERMYETIRKARRGIEADGRLGRAARVR